MTKRLVRTSLALMAASTLIAAACGGDDTKFGNTGGGGTGTAGTGAGGEGGGEPGVFEPAAGGVRRLLGVQYSNSIAYLFGVTAADAVIASDLLPTDNPVSGYAAIGAAETPPGLSFPEFYDLAAHVVAEATVADVEANGASSHFAGFLPCVGEASPDPSSCYADLAQDFAPILFRRPITQDDVNWITDIADQAYDWSNGNFYIGLEYALRGMLQAPSFLYLPEVGEQDATEPTFYRLTGYEMASRMAFFLTDTTPDLELLDAAQSGALDTDGGITTQATRLLASPAARLTVQRRFREFLYLDGVMTAQKEATVYPELDDTVRQAMIEEIERLVDDVVWERNADIRELYTADYAIVNEDLAPIYGVSAPAAGTWEKVTLPAEHARAGFLSSAAFMTRASHAVLTSPTKRGVFIKDRVLCEEVPPPDPGVVTVLPDPQDGLTTKELVELHMNEPSCASCHQLFDPYGFALEHFDGIGRYRTTDNGQPIDPSAEIWYDGEYDTFDSPRSLADLLTADGDRRMAYCVMLNVFRGGIGHVETDGEIAAFDELHQVFDDGGYRLDQLLVEMTVNPAFRYVAAPEGQ